MRRRSTLPLLLLAFSSVHAAEPVCVETLVQQSEGANALRAIERLASSPGAHSNPGLVSVPTEFTAYQDEWEALYVAPGISRSLPLADGTRPERVLYFRPGRDDVYDLAIAHSLVKGRVLRREMLEVVRNLETGKFELHVGLELVARDGNILKGSQDELKTCLICHSVSPEGLHLIHGKTTPRKFPDLPHVIKPGQRPHDLYPRWLPQS